MTAEIRRIEVEGLGLRVELEGQGDTTPIVFLHGWLRSSEEWRYLAPCFAQSTRCVSIDLPGCGGSDVPKDAPWDLPWLARMVTGVLDQLKLSRVRLFTHGLGGAVGLRLCLDDPDRFEHHVSVSASTFANPLRGARGRLISSNKALGKLGARLVLTRDRVRRLLLDRHYHEPLRMNDALMDKVMAPLDRPGAKEAAWELLVLDMDPGLGVELLRLRVPTTMIWGYSDRVNLIDLPKTLEAEVECVRLMQIPNTGYQAIEDRPLSVAIYAARAFGLALPEGVEDGHPRPGTANFV